MKKQLNIDPAIAKNLSKYSIKDDYFKKPFVEFGKSCDANGENGQRKFSIDVYLSDFNRYKFDRYYDTDYDDIYYVSSLSEYIDLINILLESYYIKKQGNRLIRIRKDFAFRGLSKVEEMYPKILRDRILNSQYHGKIDSLEQIKEECDENFFCCNPNVKFAKHYIDNRLKEEYRKESADYFSDEFVYLCKFEENASLKLGQFNNPIDFAAAAQHFSTSTRLLDWSTSPFIATLFTLYNGNKSNKYNDCYGLAFKEYRENICVSYLPSNSNGDNSLKMCQKFQEIVKRYNSLCKDETILGSFFKYYTDPKVELDKQLPLKKIVEDYDSKNETNILNVYTYFEEIIKNNIKIKPKDMENKVERLFMKYIAHPDYPLFLETNYSNERLRSQRGIFELIDVNLKQPNEESFRSDLPNETIKNSSILLIDKDARKEIIKYINRLGINYYITNDDTENCVDVIKKTMIGDFSFKKEIEYTNQKALNRKKRSF